MVEYVDYPVFEIEDEYYFKSFKNNYGNTELGNLLLKNYAATLSNIFLLDTLSEEDKMKQQN